MHSPPGPCETEKWGGTGHRTDCQKIGKTPGHLRAEFWAWRTRYQNEEEVRQVIFYMVIILMGDELLIDKGCG